VVANKIYTELERTPSDHIDERVRIVSAIVRLARTAGNDLQNHHTLISGLCGTYPQVSTALKELDDLLAPKAGGQDSWLQLGLLDRLQRISRTLDTDTSTERHAQTTNLVHTGGDQRQLLQHRISGSLTSGACVVVGCLAWCREQLEGAAGNHNDVPNIQCVEKDWTECYELFGYLWQRLQAAMNGIEWTSVSNRVTGLDRDELLVTTCWLIVGYGTHQGITDHGAGQRLLYSRAQHSIDHLLRLSEADLWKGFTEIFADMNSLTDPPKQVAEATFLNGAVEKMREIAERVLGVDLKPFCGP